MNSLMIREKNVLVGSAFSFLPVQRGASVCASLAVRGGISGAPCLTCRDRVALGGLGSGGTRSSPRASAALAATRASPIAQPARAARAGRTRRAARSCTPPAQAALARELAARAKSARGGRIILSKGSLDSFDLGREAREGARERRRLPRTPWSPRRRPPVMPRRTSRWLNRPHPTAARVGRTDSATTPAPSSSLGAERTACTGARCTARLRR